MFMSPSPWFRWPVASPIRRTGSLTVPVPVDVEPGRVTVRVITAAGVETNAYPIDVLD